MKVPVVSKSPAESAAQFGLLGVFPGTDMPASSTLTQQRLGQRPTHSAGMIADLEAMRYFEA